MKESTGYVFRSGNRWYARITAKDQATGRRRNIKRTAQSKADAKRLLKELAKQVQTEGVSAVDALQLTSAILQSTT